MEPADNEANMKNGNKGTQGTNKQYDQAMGNKGKLKNPNQNKDISLEHQDDIDAVANDYHY